VRELALYLILSCILGDGMPRPPPTYVPLPTVGDFLCLYMGKQIALWIPGKKLSSEKGVVLIFYL